MNRKIIFNRSLKEILFTVIPTFFLVGLAIFIVYRFVNPAPPNHIVISTSSDEGDYNTYAKLYKDILKEDGVTLEIRPSSGAVENLKRLTDPRSDVDAGFIQDGIGETEDAPNLVSLGSLYYVPIWIFYRAPAPLNRISQLMGKRIATGQAGGGTSTLSFSLLKSHGINMTNATITHIGWQAAADALTKGEIDAAFFEATPEDPLIVKLINDPTLKLMSLDQAEGIVRQIPYLHHLVLPHGAIDLKKNIPAQDVDLVSPTATLLVRDSLHPSLAYLLLKAASQVHSEPGLFEKKNEFPVDKDYEYPLSDEAKHYYKSGAPFWQRYLPFWLATLVDRFIIVVLPLLILLFPIFKLIPRILEWRVRSKIYQRYGELKFLETQVSAEHDAKKNADYLERLDSIEDRVNHMKVPLDFSEHTYVLREHIDFVRGRLRRLLAAKDANLTPPKS